MINDVPLVSVLMTSYNREKYIGEAIDSVLLSSYKNFELIIVDDNSKDKTLEIAKSYAIKDKRIKVYINERNLGDYPNRNKAASFAQGKYLKYVDADDIIYPHGLQILIEMMESYPEAGWGLCSLKQDVKKPYPFQLDMKGAYEYNYRGPGLFHKAPLSSIIKREIFNQVGGFQNIRMAGDFDMWHRLAKISSVVLMPEGIVWSREHSEQEMNSYSSFIKVYEHIKLKHLRDDQCPLDQKDVQNIIRNSKKNIVKSILVSILKLNFGLAIDNFKKVTCYV